jgi:hypothetical protein
MNKKQRKIMQIVGVITILGVLIGMFAPLLSLQGR